MAPNWPPHPWIITFASGAWQLNHCISASNNIRILLGWFDFLPMENSFSPSAWIALPYSGISRRRRSCENIKPLLVDIKSRMLQYSDDVIVENGPGLQDVAWVNDTSFALTWPGGLIHIFFTTASMPFRTFRGHKEELNIVRVSPDRKLLASIGDDKTVRIWAIEPLKMMVKDGEVVPVEGSVGGEDGQGCLHVLRAHKKPVMNCRWAPPRQGSSEKIFVR
jgi:WD40 repeat protein